MATAAMAASCCLASTEYVDLTAQVRDAGLAPAIACSQQYNNCKAVNAFDGIVPAPADGVTRYASWGTVAATTGWITYAFPAEYVSGKRIHLTDVTVKMSRYEANDALRAPATWVFYGRDSDADEWEALYTQSDSVSDWDADTKPEVSFRVPGDATYSQYKFEVTANNNAPGSALRINVGELAFSGYLLATAEEVSAPPAIEVFTRGGTEAGSRLVNWSLTDYGYLSGSADVFLDFAEGDTLAGATTLTLASGVSSSPVVSGSYLLTGLSAGSTYTGRLRATNTQGLSTSRDFRFTVPLSADIYAGGDLQAALAAAKAEIAGGAASATIRLAPGDYELASELVVDAPVTIVGLDGPDETTIRQTASDTRIASLTATGATLSGITLVGSQFSVNATVNGGGVYLNAEDAVLTNCVVRGVRTTTNGRLYVFGAGVYIDNAGVVSDCTVTGNTSTRPGFGVYVKGSYTKNDPTYWQKSILRRCRIVGNTGIGANAQGCVYYHYGVIEYCLIAGNTAERHPSVGLCPTHNAQAAYSRIDHCTIAGNVSPHTGSGLATSSNASAALHNCIIWGNSPTDVIDDGVTFSHCCVPILSSENGNISSDPGFVDAANGDYRLRADSPCAGAGEDQSDIGCFAPLQDATVKPLKLSRSWVVPGQEIVFGAPAFQDVALSATDSLEWSFGDGATAVGATASHAFATTGDYEVTFVATTADGSQTSSRTVHVVATNETVEADEDLVAAVQRVCRAAEASGTPGTVTVGPGTHVLSDQLRIDAPVAVIGAGPESTCVTQCFEMARCAVLYDPDGMYAGILFCGGRSNGGGTGIPSEPRHGLGVFMTGGVVSNCVFESMSGGGQNAKVCGGGVKIVGGLVVDSVFRNASVNADGAGAYATGGVIDRCVFTNLTEVGSQHNTGYATAVAIYGPATLRNSLVANNSGSYYTGGVYINGHRDAIVENCTIVGNTSGTTAGAGLNTANGTRNTLRNLIIHDNRTAGTVNDIAVGTGAVLDHCDVSSTLCDGTGNISVDPGFVSYGVEGEPDDFRLAQGSLCVDAGTDTVTAGNDFDLALVDCPKDGDGNGVAVRDMGCYEHVLGGDGLSCLFALDSDGIGYAGMDFPVTFTSTVLWNGAVIAGEDIGYEWDFGDGASLSGVGSEYATPTHVYGGAAKRTVTLTVTYQAETADFERAECVALYPATVYVAEGGGAAEAFPYATAETACSDLDEAYACVRQAITAGATSGEVRLLPGAHHLATELVVDGPVHFVGLGATPEATSVVPATLTRGFVLRGAGALVENLCVTGVNISDNGEGGAFHISGSSIVSNVVVASCAGSGHGANRRGVAFYATDGLIVDCVVRDCHGNYGWRGAENVFLYGNAVMDRCVITNNYGGGEGGTTMGQWTNFGQPGIGASVNGNATLRNSLIACNRSAYKAGAGVYLTGNGSLVNCTVVSNRMVDVAGIGNYEHDSAGVLIATRTAKVENCVIALNILEGAGESNLGVTPYGTLDVVSYSIAPGADLDAAEGNLVLSPVFRDAGGGDWRLSSRSPGVNAGLNADWMEDATDLLGSPRLVGRVDMGCYENPAGGTIFILR